MKKAITALICCFFFLGRACAAPAFAASPVSERNSSERNSSERNSSEESGFQESSFPESGRSDEDESYPFGEMPDMKQLLEALDIIGDTPLDQLTSAQLEKLAEIGFDRETLEENKTLIDELIESRPDKDEPSSAGSEDRIPNVLWIGSACAACGAAAIIFFSVRHKTRSSPQKPSAPKN